MSNQGRGISRYTATCPGCTRKLHRTSFEAMQAALKQHSRNCNALKNAAKANLVPQQ